MPTPDSASSKATSTPAAMSMADPNMSTLQDVQRELDAIKAERRRRQQALYDIRQPGSHKALPSGTSSSLSLGRFPTAVQALICANVLGRKGEVDGHSLPYRPEINAPLQLMTMAYVLRPDGRLSPSPSHFMGNLVESLDLSPWDVSSTASTDGLWRTNKNITTLKLSGRSFELHQGDSLQALSAVGPQLTNLELSACFGVSPEALRVLLRGVGGRLVSLNLSRCLDMGDEHAAEVARGCPSITSVDMSSCRRLTDQGLARFAVNDGLSSLQRLLVSDCPCVGDRGLRAVLDGITALQELSAGGCHAVTGRAFLGETYAGGVATAPVRSLKRLDLPDCPQLDQSAVEWIAAGCTALRSLVVSGCVFTKPEGVELLAANRGDLLRLSVAGCLELGRSTALAFVAERSGSYLRHLDISDIPAMAAAVVGKLLKSCGRLEFIDLSGLTNVDRSSFRGLGGGRSLDAKNHNSEPKPSVDFGGVAAGEEGSAKSEMPAVPAVPTLPFLRVARMIRLPSLDDTSVVHFANACPRLEEFLMSDSPMVTGACLAPLASLCPLLRSLGLDRCRAASDEASLAATCRSLPGLENLAVGVAVERGERETQSRTLTDSSHTPGRGHGKRGGSGARGRGGGHARRAPYGGVSDASSLSSASSSSSVIGESCLRSDPASDINLFTGEALLAAAAYSCSRLTTLGIEGHKRVTVSPGQCSPGAFPCLTELRLEGCVGVDDRGLLELLKACPRVRSLSLEGSGVSRDGLARSISSVQLSFVDLLPPSKTASPGRAGESRSATSSSHQTRGGAIPPRRRLPGHEDVHRLDAAAVPSSLPQPPSVSSSSSSMVTVRPAGFAKAASTRGATTTDSKSSSSRDSSIRLGMAVGDRRMATGLKPASHHQLCLTTAAMCARFDEENRALETLGRALRHFRDRRLAILTSSARAICRGMLAYRFRTFDGQPDKVRLKLARNAAKRIQALVRAHHGRKRDASAVKFQALWRGYTARCMFIHQLRLRRAAIGFQLIWRGYYVRTRYRVREKVQELKMAKKILGKQWFKRAAALKGVERDPANVAAEQRRRREMSVGIQQCYSFVRGEIQRLGARGALKCQAILEDEETVSFGAMPPAPSHKIVRGAFDIQPQARRLHDGREVPFDGEANLSSNPHEKGSLTSMGGRGASVSDFAGENTVRDPNDFDVFQKGPGELWDEEESGAAGAQAAAERTWAMVMAADSAYDKERSLCAHCKRRFASVSCKDCRRGYCLRCSGQVHSQPARLGHDLGPFQRPERTTDVSDRGADGGAGKKRDATRSKKAARRLPSCANRAQGFIKTMKVLKHKASLKADEERVRMKERDRREMEKAEERARKQYEECNRASEGEKNAATLVQKTCKGYMAKLRLKRDLELRKRAQAEAAKLKMKVVVTRVQALYRGFSVRSVLKESTPSKSSLYIGGTGTGAPAEGRHARSRTGSTSTGSSSAGVLAPPINLPSRSGLTKDKAAAAVRARRDCAFRRRWEREAAIAEMKDLEEEADRTFVSDVRWAVELDAQVQTRSNVLKNRRKSARSAWNRLQEEQSRLDPALPPEDPERKRLIKEIELQDIRIQHLISILESVEKDAYWTRAFIRQHYRRHAAHVASKAGARHTFAWLEEELHTLDEVVAFASKRKESAADVLEQEFFRGWLTDQMERAGKQRLLIDLEQESLLETETARLLKGKAHASKTRQNLEELIKAYFIDRHLQAERVGADLASSRAEEGTDEKFLWVSRITALKDKEESVRRKVQASLQRGLEEDIAAEDRYLNDEANGYIFSGDVADAPMSHFAKIKASLVDPPHHPAHLSFESWRKVYRAQPWLAAQTQAEYKRKAARASTIEELEEMRAVNATAKSQEAFAAKEVAALKSEIETLERRLAFNRSGVMGDAAQEPLSDQERTRMETELMKGREKLIDQEERLERRRKTNSRKEDELKQKEEDLEAEITAEQERHARQAAAMAAFRAAERDESAAQFGKEHADAAVEKMKSRLEKLKAIQEELCDNAPEMQQGKKKKKGFMGTLVDFALGHDGEVDEESEAQQLDYAEQTQLIAKKAKLALVNRQIEDLKKAKKTISTDYASADAQLALAEDVFAGDDGQETTAEAQKLQQARVREAKQRAMNAKKEEDNRRQQTKQEEAALEAEAAKRKAEREIAKRVAEEMGMGGVGKAKGIMLTAQRIKRKVVGGTEMYGGNFDNEAAAVEAAIKTRHKTKLGKVEAVDDFAFTVGVEETDAMASKQARLESQGLPNFRKMPKGFGGKECVFLWVRKTLDSSEFITEIQVTHADPENPGYKNLKPLGFTAFGHPQLAAKGSGRPSLLLWGKKDPHSDGIADIDLSYNQADEKKLSDVGFKMVPGLLVECGLPDVRLWYSTVKRGAQTLPAVKVILHEIAEVRNMRKQNPGDAKLMDVESKLESKLAQAREAEERKAEDRSNPLKSAIETYALTGTDIDTFISHFAAMDTERQGTIEIGAFFEYFEWPRNTFANHLFSFMESADEDGRVDFGDFVKLVCSYCMFGKADLLKYAYTVYDQGKGYVSFEDLMSLLNDVHKTNSGPIEKALRDADIARIGQLSFSDFLDLDRRFPKMFYPVANLQLEIRKRFLGEAFWVRKMHMFNEGRGNIIKEADGSASKARKAKLREEEINYLKMTAKNAFSATQKSTKMVANRARQKIEGSKWMSKLLS